MNTDLIYRAIGEDHRLEAEVDAATMALAQHRWRWTRDTTNLDKISDAEYAQRLGRSTRDDVTQLVEDLTRLAERRSSRRRSA